MLTIQTGGSTIPSAVVALCTPITTVTPLDPADAVLHAQSVAACDYEQFRGRHFSRAEFGRKLSTFLAQREEQWCQSRKSVAWRKAYLTHFDSLAIQDPARLIDDQSNISAQPHEHPGDEGLPEEMQFRPDDNPIGGGSLCDDDPQPVGELLPLSGEPLDYILGKDDDEDCLPPTVDTEDDDDWGRSTPKYGAEDGHDGGWGVIPSCGPEGPDGGWDAAIKAQGGQTFSNAEKDEEDGCCTAPKSGEPDAPIRYGDDADDDADWESPIKYGGDFVLLGDPESDSPIMGEPLDRPYGGDFALLGDWSPAQHVISCRRGREDEEDLHPFELVAEEPEDEVIYPVIEDEEDHNPEGAGGAGDDYELSVKGGN